MKNRALLLWPAPWVLFAALVFVQAASASTVQIFSNGNTPITINDNSTATPYPSNITVSGVAPAIVTKVSVILSQFSHTFPADVDVLLVGPQGQRCMLMSDGGSGNPGVSNVSLTFSSTATTAFPQTSAPVTGTYRPVNYVNDLNENDPTDTFLSLSPATLTDQAADLTVFNLTDPNGVWKLYVVDDNGTDMGSIGNGWLLVLTVPTVFTVNSTDDTTDGVCNATNCTLREALAAAGNGDLINFSSLFDTSQTINLLTVLPNIAKSVTIQGPGANLLTVRRDYNATTDFRIFTISPGVANGVAISGMTITGGRTSAFGGGIDCESNLTLTNVHVTGNHSSIGGGGVGLAPGGSFTDCTFSGNTSNATGGGIFYVGADGRTLRVINSTISGNQSTFGGGGINNQSDGGNSRLEVVNSTIVNNTANSGGGIVTFTQGGIGNTATTTLRNTIIAGNSPNNLATQTGGGGAATFQTLGFNLSDNYTGGGFTPLGSDITTATPRLGPLRLGGGRTPTHALLGGSPAHGAGNASGLATDQRGVPRPSFAADIGAVEMVSIVVTNNDELGAGSLRQAIIDANQNATPLDDIIFSDTVFNTAKTITLTSGELAITSNLTINGPGANLLIVRRDSAAAAFTIFNIPTGGLNVAISGITISNGRDVGDAGQDGFGGGIDSVSNLTLTGVHVTGNQASSGGGVSLALADGIFTGCTFSLNTATIDGAGISFQGDNGHFLRVAGSTVSGNMSGNNIGGSILNISTGGNNSRMEVIGSTVANNTGGTIGGGIVTFTQNAGSTAMTTLRNTIIAGNTPNNLATGTSGGGAATLTTQGFNLASDNGGGFLNAAPITTDKINANAGLAPLLDNGGGVPTRALLGTSAALDAGNNSGSGTLTDQRGAGFPRTVELPFANATNGDGTDIGAFEAQTTPTLPTLSINDVSNNEDNSGTSNFTFTVTLSAASGQPVTVSYQTADGTAAGPSDYAAIGATTLTFAPGETSKQVSVAVNGDTTFEPSETFFVNLSNAQGATISDNQGLGTIGNDDAAPTPSATATATPTATPTAIPGLVANVSTRLPVGTGDNALIEGFIVVGPPGSTKKIIVRATGPSLIPFGIADAVANPTLEIFDANNTKIASNDDWKTTQVGGIITGDQFAEINGSGVPPSNDLESAIVANLAPGAYTAVVRGAGNTVGTGVVDAFDLSAGSTARLANIATRGLIQPGDKLMIAGFIVQGGSVQAVLRAIGPSLAAFGITNALPDTTLQLRDQNGTIVRENDDWMTDQKAELEAIGLQPSHDLEAALVQTIQPGQYTAQVRGKPEATGTGVVQIYFLQ